MEMKQEKEGSSYFITISMHYAIRAVIFEGGVFQGQKWSQNFRFLTATTFVKNTPLIWGETFLKSEKYSLNISPHFLDAAEG